MAALLYHHQLDCGLILRLVTSTSKCVRTAGGQVRRRKVHHERHKYWYLLPTDPPQLTTRRRIRSLCKQHTTISARMRQAAKAQASIHTPPQRIFMSRGRFSPSRSRSMYLLNNLNRELGHESSAWWAARRKRGWLPHQLRELQCTVRFRNR
jgi:hypothetical protein